MVGYVMAKCYPESSSACQHAATAQDIPPIRTRIALLQGFPLRCDIAEARFHSAIHPYKFRICATARIPSHTPLWSAQPLQRCRQRASFSGRSYSE